MLNVYLDPSVNICYASFYIKGLQDVFGRKQVTFNNRYFSDLHFSEPVIAFIVQGANKSTKFIIDYADAATWQEAALSWSDYYLKINIDPNAKAIPNKIISIGPGFGIRFLNGYQTIFWAIRNYMKAHHRIKNARQFFSHYKAQWNRPCIRDYDPYATEENYIFFTGSIWKREIRTNQFRANFIRVCKKMKALKFEGGFAPRKNNDVPGWEELTLPARIPMQTYMQKMARSCVAFNTPAVQDCHGWKLGEFFCFGKVILSTPFTRKFPRDPIGQEHYISTTGEEDDIEKKLQELIANKPLREKLRQQARKYFEEVLAPEVIAEKIKALHQA